MEPIPAEISKARERWGILAKENGWFKEPFYIQIWYDKNTGKILDSVGHRGLVEDILIPVKGRDEEGWYVE